MNRTPGSLIVGVCLLTLWLAIAIGTSVSAAAEAVPSVTLVLHGMSLQNDARAAETTWGKLQVEASGRLRWSGLVGYLRARGMSFGGTIRSQAEVIKLPRDLDTLGADKVGRADFYLLSSSLPCQENGLASQVHELASAIAELRRVTAAPRITLLAYSAGGVVARMYVQGAVHGVQREQQVDRLITIATPHLGLARGMRLACRINRERFRDLWADSRLLRRLNHELELPIDIAFCSVALRGVEDRVIESATDYQNVIRLPASEFRSLPPLLRSGSDGVAPTMSQLLHLTPTAARYESRTGRGIGLAVVSIAERFDRLQEGHLTIHTAGLERSELWSVVHQTMTQDPVRGQPDRTERSRTQDHWARQIAEHLTQRAMKGSPLKKVSGQRLLRWQVSQRSGSSLDVLWQSGFQVQQGWAFFGSRSRQIRVEGSIRLYFDRFDRPRQLEERALLCSEQQ